MSARPLPTDRIAIVAEIGNNHEGSPEAARALVRAAADAGCDAVKLQVFQADWFVRPSDPDRLARMRGFELAPEVVIELLRLIRDLGMSAVATPLDMPSLELLIPEVDALKIASGDNDVLPLLEAAAATFLPVILSTGLADMAGVTHAVDIVRCARGDDLDLTLLQCTSAYPIAPEDANLRAIFTLAGRFGLPVGYSDHTLGVEVAVMSAAAGAVMIEKHFTLDHDTSDFRDHQLSAEPDEMRELVKRVRQVERALGSPEKAPRPVEEPLQIAARRSIVAARELAPGERITSADLTWMRPRDGLAPGQEDLVVGHCVARAVAFGESIQLDDLAA
jgi:N,N'-diacetyllegionaminate synthase